VVCADDPSAPYFAAATKKPVYSFSSKGKEADFEARDIVSDASGASFTIVDRRGGPASGRSAAARIELPGAFNVDNALAALIAVSGLTGEDWESYIPLLPRLKPVLGRMTTLKAGQPFEVIVDYAHTPSSFRTVFPPIRERAKGRMICVFGSGGERDTEKRPEQGRIAADYFDIVILADEDPRGEEPTDLLEEIAAGCPERRRGEDLLIIPDRPTAIRRAFALARPGDIVMLLGKGHENSIIYKDGPHPYDEISCALGALAELGYKEKA
jgi:UDP-N-acetylmuramoyl-L-alanyl-D-glutamate--2,6-diaminopimelate ligase